MIREVLTLDHLDRLGPDGAASLLLVRQDAGDDGHDEPLFDAWLAADPTHADAWTRACSAWVSLDGGTDHAELRDLREAARTGPAPRQRWGFAIAASVAVIIATGGALVLNRSPESGSAGGNLVAGADAIQTLTTAKGEQRSFALADASVVTLNTDSAVAVAFKPSGARRLELLRGQAYFKVARDKKRPFTVAFEDRTVTALGTAFEVRGDRDAMRVVLVEGRVSVRRAGDPPITMRAGQQLLAGPRSVRLSMADVGAVGDWQRGVVTFRYTSLKAAAAELNRYSDKQLVVRDPRVARLTVSGVFRTNDAGRFARTVAAILPVRVVAAKEDDLEIVAAAKSSSGPTVRVSN